MKIKIFIIAAVILIMVGCISAMYFNSNYHYSKKLVSAIKEENIIAVQQIVEKKPNCVNIYPTLAPDWWQSLMDESIGYPLVEACLTGNVEIIEILVENGADVNLGARFTPLGLTYFLKPANWYDISLYLLENGASLDYKTPNSEENVLTDIVAHRPGAVEEELENSTEVALAFYHALENCDHSNVNWMRVLQHSVSNDRIEIVKLLLDQGYCTVNDTSVGMTALMFAARDSTVEMVQLLLSYGADKSIKCDEGKTAYDYAVQSNNEDIIAILKN